MGCCFSRSAGPNSPYPGGAPESSRAITAGPATEQPTTTEPPTTGASLSGPASQRIQQQQQQQRRRRRDSRPLDQHINKPLRRQEWVSTARPWSKRQLARERSEYFHTRVTGRPEVWQTIHAALRILWEDSSSSSALASSEGEQRQQDEDDATGALATAQTLLSAADISLPTGLLSSGVYDSLGNYYPLPQHIVCDPVNVIDDGLDEDAKGGGDDAEDTTAEDDDESDDDDDVVKGGKGKGKGVVEVVEKITVRARLSENGWDYAVKVNKTDSVRSISKKIAEQASLPSTKKLRIAYMGKILKENISLEAQGWQPGHIVNGFVFFQTSA